MMSVETHTLKPIYNSHSVCSDCGACTCHTPNLMSELCADVYAGSYRIFDHEAAMTESEKAVTELRKKLNGTSDVREPGDFEIRKLALEWTERNFSNVISPRTKMGLVRDTENYIRTGSFQENMMSKAVNDLATALVQTRDYVQPLVILHAQEGWSWYDALKEHAPFVLQQVLDADARAHARKSAESDEMENGDSNG